MRMFWRDLHAADETQVQPATVASWRELPCGAAAPGENASESLHGAVTRDDLRSAYHLLARETHPDRMPEAMRAESEERMKRLNLAYQSLLTQMLVSQTRHMPPRPQPRPQ